MDFTFTTEQKILRSNLNAYLQDHYGFEARRTAAVSESGWRPEFWKALATDLGILGVGLPEAVGGVAGDAIDVMIIMEELGSALVLEPYIETVVVAGGLLSHAGGDLAQATLAGLVAGDLVVVFAGSEPSSRYRLTDVQTRAVRFGNGWKLSGVKAVVVAAPWASKVIVSARTGGSNADATGISLFLIDRNQAGVAMQDYPTVDGRRASDIVLRDVVVGQEALIGPEGGATDILEFVADSAIAAVSAEAVGVVRRMLSDTVDYTRERRQFGQPIASFQVLQHRMVDMYIQTELAASAARLATLKLHRPAHERAQAASAGKVTVANACRIVGQGAVQLHGGMGMTDELAVGHYFKRATVIEQQFGSADHHLARFDRLSRAAA